MANGPPFVDCRSCAAAREPLLHCAALRRQAAVLWKPRAGSRQYRLMSTPVGFKHNSLRTIASKQVRR